MRKTLLVGLDAACWKYLEPLLTAAEMPCLQKLMDTGTWGTLRSTMPAWTPTAWASICTGKNPGKHGIFDMLLHSPEKLEPVAIDATRRAGTPFWQYLNNHQIRVGLVNVPFTYPPQPVDGFLVCGFGTPNSVRQLTYPENILAEIEGTSGQYRPEVDLEALAVAPPQIIFTQERELQRRHCQIAAKFAESFAVDVLVINLMFTDHANHKMPSMEQVQEAYRQSDTDLASLIESFQPDNIMLISDHGSNRLQGTFLLGAWLRDQGYYLEQKNDIAQQTAVLNWTVMQWLQSHHGWAGISEKVLRRLAREFLWRAPAQLTHSLWEHIEDALPFAQCNIQFRNQPDYTRSPLIPGSVYSGLLYLNKQHSQTKQVAHLPFTESPIGIELVKKLQQITDPQSGFPLFSAIYSGHELYSGAVLENAPDLVLDSYDSAWNIRTSQYHSLAESTTDRYFIVPKYSRDYGWHSRDGIFIFSGSDFATGQINRPGHVMDIPATLLHLYNVPIPEDYDGQVLIETMSPELQASPIQSQKGDEKQIASHISQLTSEEQAQLVGQLRALGYLS